MFQIDAASPADLEVVQGLLSEAGLPTSDLGVARPQFLVVRERKAVIGAGALQRFGAAALLRSLVVADGHRKRGLGRQIVEALEQRAAEQGVGELILLTETAADFFERAGYRLIERSRAPAAVQESAEFRSLCPSTAVCMGKVLTAAHSA
ncbi:MAG: GNAT family N-acetyltransferase [Proteobacteria bacterium]|nr:GNAT family N-acetyltransferase [Pseudomonadota bacterium]